MTERSERSDLAAVVPLGTVRRTRLVVDVVWIGETQDYGAVIAEALSTDGACTYDLVELEDSQPLGVVPG